MSTPQDVPYTFPAPIGGAPMDLDFAPSILYVVLYAFIVVLAVNRFARSSSRTFITFGSMAFAIER